VHSSVVRTTIIRALTYGTANTSVVVVAPRYLDELKRLPDDVLSMEDAVAQVSVRL
jgi:hypothetical protein